MSDAVNRCAQELIRAISAAVAKDPDVQACRARAQQAGFEIKVSLEAQVNLADQPETAAHAKVPVVPSPRRLLPGARTYEITAADRRFLRSLRIAVDEATERVE